MFERHQLIPLLYISVNEFFSSVWLASNFLRNLNKAGSSVNFLSGVYCTKSGNYYVTLLLVVEPLSHPFNIDWNLGGFQSFWHTMISHEIPLASFQPLSCYVNLLLKLFLLLSQWSWVTNMTCLRFIIIEWLLSLPAIRLSWLTLFTAFIVLEIWFVHYY